jgi:hypothetical protein
MTKNSIMNKLWLSRLLIGLVFAWNAQAALTFLLRPGAYAWAYELSGVAGEAAVRGVGVLFLMWNVPYAVAFWHPVRFRLALTLALVMQFVGFVGESFILAGIPVDHPTLRGSILRFILFDGTGLLFLILAAWLVKHEGDAR